MSVLNFETMTKSSTSVPPIDAVKDATELYMTAEEAATRLGVNVSTIYVYVSRKLIRSEPVPGSRARRYWAADVDRLKHGKAGGSTEPESQLVESRITLISDTGLYYRGKNAVALAESASYEEIVSLLWQADAIPHFRSPVAPASDAMHSMFELTRSWTCVERAISMFPLIERANLKAYDLSHDGYTRTGVDAIRWFMAFILGLDAPPTGPTHDLIVKRLKAPKGFNDVVRKMLVLCADHELEHSTAVVRAAAKVGITPYKAVMTGLIASQGQWFIVDRQSAVSRFVDEIIASSNGADAVISRLRAGESLPGFGDSLHRVDPRTVSLMESLTEWNNRDIEVRRLKEALSCASEVAGLSPRFILPVMLVGKKLKLHGQEMVVAIFSRLAGWLAHAFEQQQESASHRTRASYVGLLP